MIISILKAKRFTNMNIKYIKAGIVVVVILMIVLLTSRYKDGQYAIKEVKLKNDYIAQMQKMEISYKEQMRILNQNALKKQAELAQLNSDLEKKYHDANEKTNKTLSKYNALVANGFRLRDKYESKATSGMSSSAKGNASTTTNSSNGTTSGHELSREATSFLLEFAADADKVVDQLLIAQEYAKELRKQCEQ